MVVKENGEEVVRIPAKALADEATFYVREEKKPGYLERVKPVRTKETSLEARR
jgi:hypothetical protein